MTFLGWQRSGFDYDTCCRLGWADDMRGSADDTAKLKRNKIANDVAINERINKELAEEAKAKGS